MKKFIVRAFQQKYYLPVKVKEKSANYLKNVQKIGKHLSTVKIMKKANMRKQNHHLSSAQRFVISFVYNCIWKRIACSFVDLITPSIVKSQQLTKITDYRNHIGFCEGTELPLKTRGESYLKSQSTPTHTNMSEKVFTCANSGNKFPDSSTNEESWKVDKKCQLKSGVANGVQYLNERNESSVFIPNKETFIPHSNDLKHQQNDGNSECFHEKNINNTLDHETNGLSLAVPCLETNSSGLSGMQKNNSKECNPFLDNSTLQYYKDNFDKEKPCSVKWVKPSKIKDKSVRNTKKYHKRKTSNDLPKGSKPKQGMDNNSPTKTSPTLLNNNRGNKLNKQRSLISDRQGKNELVKEKTEVEVNVPRTAQRSLKTRENRNNKWYSGLTQNEQKNYLQPSLLDRKEFPKNVSETGIKQDNLREKGFSFLEENENFEDMSPKKSKDLTQQEAGNRLQQVNEMYNKSMTKINHSVKEDPHFSEMRNKTSSLQNELVRVNKGIKSKSSKTYKKKKRKASFEKKLKSIILQTQVAKNFQLNNKKNKIKRNEEKTGYSNSEEYEFQNKKSPFTETYKTKPDSVNNYLKNKEKLTNQDQIGLTDSPATSPEVVKTNLVVFDTTRDDAQLLVQEQSLGINIKSSLIDLNTVITEENSLNLSKNPHKKTEKPVANDDCSHDETKSIKNDFKNVKSVAEKPWKRSKVVSAESRNRSKTKTTSSGKSLDSGTSIPYQKYDIKKRHEAQHTLTNKSSTSNMLSESKLNNNPLGKTLSENNVFNKNKQESLSPKKTKSAESSNLKVSFPTKNQTTQINDENTTKHYHLNNKHTVSKTGSTINPNKEQKKELTEKFDEKKIGATNGNEKFVKSGKVISVKQKLDTAEIQVKGKPKDNSNSTKNVTLKETNTNSVSTTRPTHVTPSTVGTNSNKENKFEKQTPRSQEVKASVANLNPKTSNLEKKVPPTFSSTNTGLESLNDAHIYDKNKTKDADSFQNPVPSKPKSSLKASNKTNLDYNDLLLSKTVADISQGLNEISGKEEFKSKMNQLLHNFTVTGQNQQPNNIQRQIKSQEIVKTKHGKEQKLNKSINRTEVVDKSISNEVLNVKLKNNESSIKQSNLAINKTNNIKITTKTSDVSGNKGVQENILLSKPNTKKPVTASVRPALGVPKDTKPHENVTKAGEKNIQRQSVAKVRNTTNIVPPAKNKTVVSNKSEPKIIETTSHREVKQHVPANSNLKNNEVDKKVLKPTTLVTQEENVSTKTEMLRKLIKKRPTE